MLPGSQTLAYAVEVKYVGQNAALSIPIAELPITPEQLTQLAEDFSRGHLATFGYRSDGEGLQLVSLNVLARGVSDTPRIPERIAMQREGTGAHPSRRAYFGADHGWIDTRVSGAP